MRVRRPITNAAFTLIEIAISLAIIAFALVAIIGVLPLGLEVQRENREETIINHDVQIFMDSIRNGARGVDDLTNYVYAITNDWVIFDAQTNVIDTGTDWYVWDQAYYNKATLPNFGINNGARIVGLLSTPKRVPEGYGPVSFRSNHVFAAVRAISGPASEKFPQTDPSVQGLAFSYRLIPEVVRAPAYDLGTPYGKSLDANIRDVRLLFRWPLLPNGDVGNSRQTYRSSASGALESTNDIGQPLFFFNSTLFTNAP